MEFLNRGSQADHDADFLSQPAELDNDGRVYYPYSVIPGGAKNEAELRSAVAHDAVVANHYSDFDLGRNSRRCDLREARAVFVSYRVGNRIFWTKNRMTLPAGRDGADRRRAHGANTLRQPPFRGSGRARAEGGTLAGGDGSFRRRAGPLAMLVAPPEIPLVPPPTTGIVVPETPSGVNLHPADRSDFSARGSAVSSGSSHNCRLGAGVRLRHLLRRLRHLPVAAPEPSSVLMLTASLAASLALPTKEPSVMLDSLL